ncbi:MAG: hypothetical protein ACREBU_17725, partial [Nitrososphaera sp.]
VEAAIEIYRKVNVTALKLIRRPEGHDSDQAKRNLSGPLTPPLTGKRVPVELRASRILEGLRVMGESRVHEIYEHILRFELLAGKPQKAISAAIVLALCREKALMVSLGEIQKFAGGVNSEDIESCYRILAETLDIEYRSGNLSNYVKGLAIKAGLDKTVVKKALEILSVVPDNYEEFGLNGLSIAAGGLLVAAINLRMSEEVAIDLAEATETGTRTVTNIAERIAKLFREKRRQKPGSEIVPR